MIADCKCLTINEPTRVADNNYIYSTYFKRWKPHKKLQSQVLRLNKTKQSKNKVKFLGDLSVLRFLVKDKF